MDNPEPNYREIYDALIQYISERKQEIYELIHTDHKIQADTYDNVARLREVQKIEKIKKRSQDSEVRIQNDSNIDRQD